MKFHENPPSGSRVLRGSKDGRTDRQKDIQTYMTMPIVAFRNFANASKTLRAAHTVHLSVLCGSENKQRLFPYTALIDWFV